MFLGACPRERQKARTDKPQKFDHIKLEDGKQVIVEYETKPLAASICMVGTIVEITCISEK